jgi:hypothetical protein
LTSISFCVHASDPQVYSFLSISSPSVIVIQQLIKASSLLTYQVSLLAINAKTSTASLVKSVLQNVLKTITADFSAGESTIASLTKIYSTSVEYVVKGLCSPMAAASNLLSMAKIIVVDSTTYSKSSLTATELELLSSLRVGRVSLAQVMLISVLITANYLF